MCTQPRLQDPKLSGQRSKVESRGGHQVAAEWSWANPSFSERFFLNLEQTLETSTNSWGPKKCEIRSRKKNSLAGAQLADCYSHLFNGVNAHPTGAGIRAVRPLGSPQHNLLAQLWVVTGPASRTTPPSQLGDGEGNCQHLPSPGPLRATVSSESRVGREGDLGGSGSDPAPSLPERATRTEPKARKAQILDQALTRILSSPSCGSGMAFLESRSLFSPPKPASTTARISWASPRRWGPSPPPSAGSLLASFSIICSVSSAFSTPSLAMARWGTRGARATAAAARGFGLSSRRFLLLNVGCSEAQWLQPRRAVPRSTACAVILRRATPTPAPPSDLPKSSLDSKPLTSHRRGLLTAFLNLGFVAGKTRPETLSCPDPVGSVLGYIRRGLECGERDGEERLGLEDASRDQVAWSPYPELRGRASWPGKWAVSQSTGSGRKDREVRKVETITTSPCALKSLHLQGLSAGSFLGSPWVALG